MNVHALPIDTECEELGQGSFRLHVRGELDLATAPLVERALAECVGGGGAVRVLVDLSQVDFIDAAGLRLLNGFQARLAEDGGELLVSRPSWQVRRVLATVAKRCRLRVAPE